MNDIVILRQAGKVFHGQKILCPKCKEPTTFTRVGNTGACCNNCGHTVKSDIKLIDKCYYTKKCKCGEVNFCLTQVNDSPEYYQTVGISCKKCGKIIWFKLPVN